MSDFTAPTTGPLPPPTGTIRGDATLRLLRSFSFPRMEFPSILQAGDIKWTLTSGRQRVWEERPVSRDDFAPALAGFINGDADVSSCNLFRVTRPVMSSPLGFAAEGPWALRRRGLDIPVQLSSIELIVFRSGIGFVGVTLSPSAGPLDRWFDVCHYGRFTDASGRGPTLVPARIDAGALWQPEPDATSTTVWRLTQRILDQVVPGEELGDPFPPTQLLAYSVAFADSKDPTMALVYRSQNFFRSGQQVVPATGELDGTDDPYLEYSKDQFFYFSLDGGGFLAVNAPSTAFNRSNLPSHLEGAYFLLFLFAAHQHYVLSQLAKRIAECWAGHDELERRETFRSIFDELLDFTARGHFSQAMQRDHHHRVYSRWYETFHLDRSYANLRRSVRDMLEYSQLIASEADAAIAREDAIRQVQFERRIGRWTLLLAPPAMILALFGVNITGVTSGDGVGPAALAVAVVTSVGLGTALSILMGRWPLRRPKGEG